LSLQPQSLRNGHLIGALDSVLMPEKVFLHSIYLALATNH
jgi:hypothetical protein